MPLFRVGRAGDVVRIADVRPYAPSGHFLEGGLPRWLNGARGNGTFDGHPVFFVDQRPQGFLGRTFAQRHADLGLPEIPDDWTEDDAFVALARAGEDSVGDLVLGEVSAQRLYAQQARGPEIVGRAQRSARYPELAGEAIGGVVPGSSLGGHQPKFGAVVEGATEPSCVLVKFSPAEYSAPARRWCDLLACEQLAGETLRAHGIAAAASEIVEGGSRVFLEVARFDRVGERGRRSVVSLAAMNADYIGMPYGWGHWVDAVERLAADRWVSPDTVARVRTLDAFGRFIANTDMHFGNLSFLPRDDGTLELSPAYDMLPMGYAPVAGDLPPREFVAPLPVPGHESTWRAAGAMALDYWGAVARDERVSAPFRAIAADNVEIVARTLDRFDAALRGSGRA